MLRTVLPAAALTDGALLGQPLLVSLTVGLHPRLGLGRRLVQRRGVGSAVVPELFVEGVLVRRLVADAPPVDLLLSPALAHLAFETRLLLLQLGERLQIDVHSLLVGAGPDDDLRRHEDDHQRQIGYQRHAQPDTMVVSPRSGIFPAVVERKPEPGPAGSLGFAVTRIFGHCCRSEFRAKIRLFTEIFNIFARNIQEIPLMSTKQQTLKAPISFTGKGLHSGVKVTMTINPAEAGTGIVFRRTDIEGQPVIPALCDHVVDTSRGTTIEAGGHRVSTIEHVMSALWTLGVDNAVIDIDAPETPILDGSAREYARAIAETGLTDQDAERTFYHVTEKMVYTIPEKGVAIILYPDDEFSVSVHVDYNSKVIGNQYATFNPGDDFTNKIAPCRTFVFLHELEPLMKMNLIKGGDLDNAIVVVENPVPDEQLEHLKKLFDKPDIEIKSGYLNNLELRCNNELARHKLLDLLGDFALLGVRIKGRVWATRPGHFANTEFMKQLKHAIRKAGEKPRFTYDCRKPALYDINDIRRMLPHRPPFLLVDRIFHCDSSSVAGIKNVTMNEPFFVGHFPEEPVMPGVLIVEAMAQCSGILVLGGVEDPENYSTYFMKIDGVKFKRKVVPGDTLQFEIHLLEPIRRGVAVVEGKAFVGETLACEAVMMAQVVKNRK